MPQRIDPQLRDLAQYIRAEADTIKSIASMLGDLRHNFLRFRSDATALLNWSMLRMMHMRNISVIFSLRRRMR